MHLKEYNQKHEPDVAARLARALVVAAMCTLVLAPRLHAEPDPDWQDAGFRRRLVFQPRTVTGPEPPGKQDWRAPTFLLVHIPVDPAGDTTNRAFATFGPRGEPLAYRIAHADDRETVLLLKLGDDAPERNCVVYYDPDGSSAGHAPDPLLRDPEPVVVKIYQSRGQGAPDSWERLLYMYERSGNATEQERAGGFARLRPPGPERERGHRRRDRSVLLDARSEVLCPRDGLYRFALEYDSAAGLEIDGRLQVGCFDPYAGDSRQVGPPIHLEAGPHAIRLLAWADGHRPVQTGWQPPGAADVEPLDKDNLLAGDRAVLCRAERIDKTLHADFSYEVRQPYAFFGCDPVFIPVQLQNATRDWLRHEVTANWAFSDEDGGMAAAGAGHAGMDIRHVFKGAAVQWAELRARDRLGFVASCRRELDFSDAVPVRHTVSATLELRASAYYPSDPVQAVVRVAGDAPGELVFTLRYRFGDDASTALAVVESLSLADGPVRMRLPSFGAGATPSISWELEHEDAVLLRETVRMLAPGVGLPPARVTADRLYDAHSNRVVLVAADASRARTQAPITTEQAFGRLVCVDAFLLTGAPVGAGDRDGYPHTLAHLVDGPDHPTVRHHPLPDWDASASDYGPLRKLVDVPAALDADTDVAILSIGLRDALRIRNAAAFEREIAALSDILMLQRHVPVVWVTPPAYPALAEDLRPFAGAIRRVAAARNMPVADLFTAFRGAPEARARLFVRDDLVLSKDGQDLAARIIAQALLLKTP